MSGTPPSDVRRIFGGRLGYAYRNWRMTVDQRLQPFGLTEATWLPLVYVSRAGAPLRQKDLAAAIGIKDSSLVRLIDALVRDGLLARDPAPDRRARLLRLTEAGRAVVAKVEAAIAEIRERLLAEIGDDELARTLDVIERIAAACRPDTEDAP